MIQAFSIIFNIFNIASPCGDMTHKKKFFRPKRSDFCVELIFCVLGPYTRRLTTT
jgi:hypothetical protein